MFVPLARRTAPIVFAVLALALLVSAGTPAIGEHSAVAKHGKHRHTVSREATAGTPRDGRRATLITPPVFRDVAITALTIAPFTDANHRRVVVTVTNHSLVPVSGFTIGMRAKRTDGEVRFEEFSAPLSLGGSKSTTVEFRLGCNWINNGTVFVRTNPSPVPGEPPQNSANNARDQSFATVCATG